MPIAVVAPRWVSTATACSAISAAASAPGGSGRSYRNPMSTRCRAPPAPITTKLSRGWKPSRCGTTASMSAGPLTRTRGRSTSGWDHGPASPRPDGGPRPADGGPGSADGGPRPADDGPGSADGGPRPADDGGLGSADGGPASADGGTTELSSGGGWVVSMNPGSCAGRTNTRPCHARWTKAPRRRALSTAG